MRATPPKTPSLAPRPACTAIAVAAMLVLGVAAAVVQAATSAADEAARESVDEAAAASGRGFAKQHHPELARLLDQLRDNSPDQYAKALAELNKSREQLERIKARNPERYESALEQWKLSSRIRLTVARMSLTKDPTLEAELRELVRTRQALQLMPLRAEEERLEKRLERVRAQLAAYDADPVQAVEREMTELQKNVRAAEAKAKLRKPAAGKKD